MKTCDLVLVFDYCFDANKISLLVCLLVLVLDTVAVGRLSTQDDGDAGAAQP